jgi:hypothetical protein
VVLAKIGKKPPSFNAVHISQTKHASLKTGGPQYYLHDVPDYVKEFLRKRGACPVVLQTPYGIARSSFMAVGAWHKISKNGRIVPGKVGHDRIQGETSIGEAIRYWYGLKGFRDFARIDLEATIHPHGHFILTPTTVTMRGATRSQRFEKVISPLSFHHDYQSKFWKQQFASCGKESAEDVAWAVSQIRRVVTDHTEADTKNVHEADLLRTAGALSAFGLDLSLCLTKGYDCPNSQFHFSGFPAYLCPVEIKKRSSGFDYQIMRYTDLPRAVVLCLEHDLVNPPDHVDVLELSALADYFQS